MDQNTTTEDQDLDFSLETPTGNEHSKLQIKNYDSRPHEDAARRRIAYSLIGLLWAIVLGIFTLLLADCIQLADIKEFAVLLGPIVALVSAATGFYYGTKSNNQ